MTPAPARVFGYVAAEADVCVLLRRGPSRQVLMVRWDLATDEFEIGQWLKARVYEDRADLSPDGRLFTYQANDGRYLQEQGGMYAVVCRPPYFTALAFWFQGSTHSRGLRWSDAPGWALDRPDEPTKGTLPEAYRKRLKVHDFDEWVASRGWRPDVPSMTRAFGKESPLGKLGWWFGAPTGKRYTLAGDDLKADWADVDHRGRVLIARDGRVFVRAADGERELIDLNPYEFQPVAPPGWAREWPT